MHKNFIFFIKNTIVIIFFLISTIFCVGQNYQISDSLQKAINTKKNVDTIIKLYENEFNELINSNDNSALQVNKELLKYGKDNNCKKCEAKSYYLEGYYYYLKGDYQLAIQKTNNSISFASKINNIFLEGKSIQILIGAYFSVNDYKNARIQSQLLIEKSSKHEEIADLGIVAYIFLGLINDEQNYFNLSILYYQKADSLNNRIKSERFQDYKGSIYGNTFIVFLKLKDYPKAEEYLIKVKDLFINDIKSERYNIAKQNFGYLEVERGNYKIALDTLIQTKHFFKTNKEVYHQGESAYLLGRAYFGLKQISLAKENFKEALEIFYPMGDSLSIGLNHKYLGDCYLYDSDSLQDANDNLSKALDLFTNLNSYDNQISTLHSLSNLMQIKNNYKKALVYEKSKDSINILYQNILKQRTIYEIETQFQTKQKEKEIIVLKTKEEVLIQQKKTQLYLFVSGLIIMFISGVFFFYQYKTKKKINKKLRELDKTKSNFFTNISHEFRTPLTLISGPIQKKLKEPNLPKEDRTSFEMIYRNSNRLLSLVDQLLDISKLEAGELQLSISKNQLLNFIGILTESFNFSAKQKNINYLPYINKANTDTWYDSDVIEKIIVNLLSNAIKYTPENGSIVCNAFVKSNQFHFEIKNTGKGLTYDDLSKIFDKFHQLNTHHEGVGIGLSLVKELVNLHKGTIDVKSTLNEWTLFKVTLPIDRISFNKLEITKKKVEKKPPSLIINEAVPSILFDDTINKDTKNNLPILLIVDDNKDIRDYIDAIFNKNYTIIKAKNGQEGIEIALKQMPDIIISDIMMPVKNGIELCNHLKKDERTSHIPIILLTAKSGEENQITGIKTGADDYITKPFSEDLLIVKIENIIKRRKKLQERYSQEIILMPKEITVNSVDEKFLTKIQKILDNNLVESSFTIEEFSKEIGMSRMQLHRKLKALTGLTTSEFIRSQRLKLAITLLKNSDSSVSEIGYSVGFNNHAYFSKCFKETYKCSPTEYLQRKK
ncbi:MAG: response regulator [Flavobacteriaceae bacterium]